MDVSPAIYDVLLTMVLDRGEYSASRTTVRDSQRETLQSLGRGLHVSQR
jgi:hypothetical protein